MVGIEWVIHSGLLQAVEASNFEAQRFLIEVLNHQVLTMDQIGQIRQHYDPWLRGNTWSAQWFRQMVSKAGGIKTYPLDPLEAEVQTELTDLMVTNDKYPFIIIARQTLDQLLAADAANFPPNVQDYLANRLYIQIVTNWQDAIQRGQSLTEARVRWLIAQGENEQVEFKKSLTSQLRRRAIETLAAFAAKNGGSVLFGVRDDGVICGVQVGKGRLESLAKEIRENTSPSLTAPHLRLEQFHFNEGPVIAVSIDSIHRECRAYGRICRRVGRETQCES